MKLFLVILSTLGAFSAHAQIQPVDANYSVSCQSSTIKLAIEQTADGIQYSISEPQGVVAGFNSKSVTVNRQVEEAKSDLITERGWLTIWLSHGHIEWKPAHSVCLPTRVTGECVKTVVPGEDAKVWDNTIDIMFDENSSKTAPQLMHVDLGQGFLDLGTGMACAASGL